jgi:flagellar basal-body rod protein FlgB
MALPFMGSLGLRAISMALDGLSMRQRVAANNVANIDTPGFKAQHVSFETQLRRALRGEGDGGAILVTTDPEHLGGAETNRTAFINVEHQNNDLRNDTNNVDIDLEMTTLAETSLRYQALAQIAGSKLASLKGIVRDSR